MLHLTKNLDAHGSSKQMKIIDNFLEEKEINNITDYLNQNTTTWYFRSSMVDNDNQFYLTHSFYNHFLPCFDFDLVRPLVEKLNMSAIVEIRANLNIKQNKSIECKEHVDFDYPGLKTAILYTNTCNGATIIGGKRVDSIKNRLVIFDTNTKHKIVTQTDIQKRIIINMNFYHAAHY